MRSLFVVFVLSAALGACDTDGFEFNPLTDDRAIVIAVDDSLFAVSFDDTGEDLVVQFGKGRYHRLAVPLMSYQVGTTGGLTYFASDRMAREPPSYRLLRVSADDPRTARVLGDPDRGIWMGYVRDDGASYGLYYGRFGCEEWVVARLEVDAAVRLFCTNGVEPGNPQDLFVSADESLVAFSFVPPGGALGGVQDLAIHRRGTDAVVFPEIANSLGAIVHSDSSGDVYIVDSQRGSVFGFSAETREKRQLLDESPSLLTFHSLYLVDNMLYTYARNDGQGTTTVYKIDTSTEEVQSFDIPYEVTGGYENDGYILFREFSLKDQSRPDTFVGFCVESPSDLEVLRVSLPAFTYRTWQFSHSLSCE